MANAFSLAYSAEFFPIKDKGDSFPVSFEKYGNFSGKGTNNFKYKIVNRAGLAKAMGAGLFPNNSSLSADPAYMEWSKKNNNRINFNPWDFVQSGNPQNDFYVWVSAQTQDAQPGTKLLYLGQALAEAGHFTQALKAYHAVLIHYPREATPSTDHSYVWYVADQALSRIDTILTRNPEIGYRLDGAKFKVKNGGDTDLSNDEFVIDPGHWVKSNAVPKETNLKKLKVLQQRGYGKVKLVQYENKHWQLLMNGKNFVVKGITYHPVPIGQHISSYGNKWMFADADENGVLDAPYESWVDVNKNGKQDANEPPVGDFRLMADMGVNAIRLYRMGDENSETIDGEAAARGAVVEYDPGEFNKDVLRDLYNRYGISMIMGDFLGAYTVGSGASWDAGTDYTDPVQLENMRMVLTNFVKDHRHEPYVLMWVLGNENLMPASYAGVNATRTQASVQVEAYLKFVNEMAELIHQLDPDHPVAVGNLDLLNLEDHAKYAPAVDIFGANLYRGTMGFGNTWKKIQDTVNRPLLITEFGCDAYDSKTKSENQKAQAAYHKGNWEDVELHLAGTPSEGNAIGGIAFEFIDEWWKSLRGGWDFHDFETDSAMAFPDGWSSEEWFGLVSMGDGSSGSLMRQLRLAYTLYKDKLWGAKKPIRNR